jgi:flagellar hook protein FlgE
MKTNERIENEDLGTIFIQGRSGGPEQKASAESTPKTYFRKILTEYTRFDPPAAGLFLLRDLKEVDLAYIEVDGRNFTIDFDRTGNRSYQIVFVGKVNTTITVPANCVVAGYPFNEDAKIQVHKGQIVSLKLTQTFEGGKTKWFAEVDGETDGVGKIIKLSEDGKEYYPDDDGIITIPVASLLSELKAACEEYADIQADKATLYWND